jgi:hypothetical protein
MTNRSRSEHLVRSSASSMMRKLSVASIASSFGRRTGSLTSLNKLSGDLDAGEGEDEGGRVMAKTSCEDAIEWKPIAFGDSPDGSGKPRLPIIEDERGPNKTGHDEPSDPVADKAVSPGDASIQVGTPERLPWGQDDSEGGNMFMVSTSAANNMQLSRPVSKQSSAPSEKENYQPEEMVSQGSPLRGAKRARTMRSMKVGARRGSVRSGLRGIFR